MQQDQYQNAIMNTRLEQHLNDIRRRLDTIRPEIDRDGNDEQRQLVNAMIVTVDRALVDFSDIPQSPHEVAPWRHEAIRPASLCINSAELLLTDTEQPISPSLAAEVERIYESAMKMNALIRQVAAQFRTSTSSAHG
jgi:hypothetical protein